MKHTTEIQALLDRYWEGETSLEEERLLREFFATEPVPEQFRREVVLFQALRAEQSVELPGKQALHVPIQRFSGLYRAAAAAAVLLLTAGVWWLTRTAPVDLPVAQTDLPNVPHAEKAVVVTPPVPDTITNEIVLAKTRHRKSHVRHSSPQVNEQPVENMEDPEQALAEIKAALELVSSKINKSKKEITRGMKEVETLDKIIKKKSDG